MWERLKQWARKWLGINLPEEEQPIEAFAKRYEDIRSENITAVISNKLAMLTFADSTMDITAPGGEKKTLPVRAQLIHDALDAIWQMDASWIAAQIFGKGGKLLIPTVAAGKVAVNVIDQDRMRIIEMDGRRIVSATLLVDTAIKDDRTYYLLSDYVLQDGTQHIRYRIVDEGDHEYPTGSLDLWAQVTPEISIANTDRLLFAFMRSPRDNRTNTKRYGVPITYGAEELLKELTEHANIYRREYRLTRPMLGLDSSLWRDPKAPAGTSAGMTIDSVRRTVQDGDDPFIPMETSSMDGKGTWMHFAPSIRQDAMEARYQSLCRRLEKACGLSQGILTERQTMNYANRDEVRAAQYDTFSVIKAMRDEWERGMADLAYAIDVLAEHFGLTPAGSRSQYEIEYDWDTSLIESTSEAWAQNVEAHSAKIISDAELRQWLKGGTLAEAQQAIDEMREDADADPVERVLQSIRSAPEADEE